jgi:flavin reductase (DIM6/NTAB) family NADH-FMN oxidoreductase RutF
MDMSVTPSTRELRDALGAFATGVAVITGIRPDGKPAGVTVNSFASVSLDPPLILWCLQNSSTSLDAFAEGGRFAVNMLAAHQQAIALRFAGKAPMKFPDAKALDPQGAPPRLAGCVCRLDCVAQSVTAAGDHRIIIGRVEGFERAGGTPLAFSGGRFGRIELDPQSQQVDSWDSYFGEWF